MRGADRVDSPTCMRAANPLPVEPHTTTNGGATEPVARWLVVACWVTWLLGPVSLLVVRMLPQWPDDACEMLSLGAVVVYLQFLALAFGVALLTTAANRLPELWLLTLYFACLLVPLLAALGGAVGSVPQTLLLGGWHGSSVLTVAFPLVGLAHRWRRHPPAAASVT